MNFTKTIFFFLILVLIITGSVFLLNNSMDTYRTYSYLANNEIEEKNNLILLPSENGLYLGAFADFGPHENEVTEEKINDFQELIGKKITWAYFSDNWFEGINFPKEQVEILQELNIIPYIRLMPRTNFSNQPEEQKYTLESIINSDFDLEIENWAKMAKQTNIPLILEFGTEVNGDWFPWNGRWNGQGQTDSYGDPTLPDGPEKFIDAYQHIIDIFHNLEVDNITWVYHINTLSQPKEPWNDIMSYYPGDSYIDWIGVSVYGAQEPNEKWIEFNDLFDKTYEKITKTTNKPIAIVEFGAAEQNEQNKKAEWLNKSLSLICENNYPNLKGLSFWHSSWVNKDGTKSNLFIDSSPKALEALREFSSSDCFTSDPAF